MHEYEWEQQIRDWILKRRNSTPELAEKFVRFFTHAFENTRYPQHAWFGAHPSTLSLVVGHIFLAAAVSSGEDKGIWLLANKDAPRIEGLEYRPARSTQKSKTPLVWVHARTLDGVVKFLELSQIWETYSQASEKIFNSPVSKSRDEIQESYGKKRLSDFWGNHRSILPDIEYIGLPRKVGAGFGDPETNRKVERSAVSFVTDWYESRGWSVRSVEADKCGYDLCCIKNGSEEHVEVKGVQGEIPSCIITAGEVRQAQNNSLFIICIVTRALSNQPQLFRYAGNQFVSNFNLEPIAFRASLRT